MYNNYRLKIEGQIVPNSMIAKGSYILTEEYRVIRSWTDALHVDHEDIARNKKVQCSFSLREHLSDEHSDFIAILSKRSNVSVEYFSDDSNTYKTATCRIDAPAWSHADIIGEQILYNAIPITITEY